MPILNLSLPLERSLGGHFMDKGQQLILLDRRRVILWKRSGYRRNPSALDISDRKNDETLWSEERHDKALTF